MTDVFRPTEYTAALIQALHADAARVRGARVLEIGVGSGAVLAALAKLGAASLCGVDIEQKAVESTAALLSAVGRAGGIELHRGDMWAPVDGRRFDLVVANLPHFPMPSDSVAGRLPTWSSGGASGRALLDAFLEGLPDHLASGGRSVITHNAFVGLARSREIAAQRGLALRVLLSVFVYVPAEKRALMTASVRDAEEGHTMHSLGPHTFAQMQVVEIGPPDV